MNKISDAVNLQSKITANNNEELIQQNPWQSLRQYTDARIALGRVGNSLPTKVNLAFQLDHAKARDAVHLALDYNLLSKSLKVFSLPVLTLQSCVETRDIYLQRPDLGRQLSAQSILQLNEFSEGDAQSYDLVIVISEGLSSLAITENVTKMLASLLPELQKLNLSLAPICIVKQGRVAVGDDVGYHLKAKMVAILIGERPGLSSPDSLGIYLTYQPTPGCADSKRNCLSNIRPRGMSYQKASERLIYLIKEGLEHQYTGVELKDKTQQAAHLTLQNFLLPNQKHLD